MTILRVMSFNIRYGSAEDGPQAWPHRRALVIERIRAFAPDLLGLQECRDGEQAGYVKTQLPEYNWLAVQRGGVSDSSPEMAPILFRSNVFEWVTGGFFWLSETPNRPGSLSWGSALPRTVTWVELRLRQAPNRSVVFINTHLDYVPTATTAAARQLRQFIDTFDAATPIILTGDFNADKNSVPYTTLLGTRESAGRRLVDVYRACHGAETDAGTFHAFGVLQPAWPIDWILASEGWGWDSAEIDSTHRIGLYPSDHFPITACLTQA